MDWIYSCPHCHAILNPDRSIVLLAEHGESRCLVGLHPQPGNYEVYLPAEVEMPAGSRWGFACPLCRQPLTTELSEDLCALDMQSGGDPHRVYFSRIAGEQATFVVSAEGLLTDHGIHTDRYLEHLIHLKYLR
jgi:hypothetical protein